MTFLKRIWEQTNCDTEDMVITVELPENQRPYIDTLIKDWFKTEHPFNLQKEKTDGSDYFFFFPEEGIVKIKFK